MGNCHIICPSQVGVLNGIPGKTSGDQLPPNSKISGCAPPEYSQVGREHDRYYPETAVICVPL